MTRRLSQALLALTAAAMISCGAEEWSYLMSQAPGQFALLFKRVPIRKVLQRKDLSLEARAKLELVLDVKQFSETALGLVHNKSYSIYRPLDREALLYNLTACPGLYVEPLRWRFPLAGELPYLGFFKKADAEREKARLMAKGNDVYVRKVNAYSMLGIAADAVYTPMLRYRDYDLAEIVIHELAHSTVWAKGYPEFNENLAVFIANQGALDYCVERFGKNSAETKYGADSVYDDLVFQKYLSSLISRLKDLYSRSDLSDEEKLRLKQELFAQSKKDFAQHWLPQMKTGNYRLWLKLDLNNAVVASFAVYLHELSLYQKVYEKNGSDMKQTIAFIKGVVRNEKGDPEDFLKAWLEKGGR